MIWFWRNSRGLFDKALSFVIGPPLKRKTTLTKDQYVGAMATLIEGMKTQNV